MRASVRTETNDYGRGRRVRVVGGFGVAPLLVALYTSAILTRTDVAAAGGAPSAMSRSTARRNSTRSASRALGASTRTAAAAGSAGPPLAAARASTGRGAGGWGVAGRPAPREETGRQGGRDGGRRPPHVTQIGEDVRRRAGAQRG